MRVTTKAPNPAAQERGHLGALACAERMAPHGAAARRELGWLVHHYACTAPDADKLERICLRLLAAHERALGQPTPR